MSTQVEPVYLVSVNTAASSLPIPPFAPPAAPHLANRHLLPQPDRAKRLIALFLAEPEIASRYNIVHVANSNTIEGLATVLTSLVHPPQLVFAASMWTPEQQEEIQEIAKKTLPGVKTHAIPPGLQVKDGPAGIVAHLLASVAKFGIPTKA